MVLAVLWSCAPGPALATTVRFDIVPTNAPNATTVQVTPGTDVPYDLYALVSSDDAATPDNNGLAFFTVDVTTNLGVPQQPLTAFTAQIGQLFTIVQSLGTPNDDDILQIGGGQNTFAGGTSQGGVAVGTQRTLIGQGVLKTPAATGVFSVGLADTSRANVFNPGSVTSAKQATFVAGPGFAVRISNATTGGNDTGNDGTNGNADGGTDTGGGDGTAASRAASEQAVVAGALFTVLGFLAVLAAFLAFGPLAGLIAIVLFPLLFLLLLMNT
jgi:hypothetical protein